MRKFGESFELTEGWARKVLKGIGWVNRKGTIGKVEPCPKFLEVEKYMFQHEISKFFSDHDIPPELALNLNQTSLFYVLPEKYTFDLKSSKTIPIKSVDNKRQITVTFTVLHQVHFYLSTLYIVVKLSVVYPIMIPLVALLVQLWKMCLIVRESYLYLP